MSTSAVTWALQNFVLSKIKVIFGNDPEIIALTSSLLGLGVGVLTTRGPIALETLRLLWRKKPEEEPPDERHVCFIPNTCPDEAGSSPWRASDSNVLYDAILWYINEHVSCEHHMTAFKNDELRVLPASNTEHELAWEDLSVVFSLVNEDISAGEDAPKKRKVGVELKAPDSKRMRKFINHCLDSHDQNSKQQQWRQKLLCHHGVGTGLVWSAEYTYNAKRWESVVLPAKMKTSLVNDLETFMNSETWYMEKGLSWNRGILMSGKPGTGKTSIIKAISNVYQMHIFDIKLHLVHDDDDLRAMFRKIPSRSVVVMEDVDAMNDIVHTREGQPDDQQSIKSVSTTEKTEGANQSKSEDTPFGNLFKSKVTLAGLLNVLDGVAGSHGRILIMTTNHKAKLDPALLRPGRCDIHLELENCTNEQISEFFRVFTGTKCVEQFPDYVLSPAQVSNVLLTHRKNRTAAVNEIKRLVEEADSKIDFETIG